MFSMQSFFILPLFKMGRHPDPNLLFFLIMLYMGNVIVSG